MLTHMERRVRVKLTCSRSHRCSVVKPGFEPRYCGLTLLLNPPLGQGQTGPLVPGVPAQLFHLVHKDVTIFESAFILKLRRSQKHPGFHLLLKNLAPWPQCHIPTGSQLAGEQLLPCKWLMKTMSTQALSFISVTCLASVGMSQPTLAKARES